MQTQIPTDRRQRKTRASLHAALVTLVDTKHFDAITVEDIVATADVARATFYAHYRDRTELLLDATRELLQDLGERVNAVAPRDTTFGAHGVRVAVEHAREHAGLYRVLLTGEGGPDARATLTQMFEDLAGPILAGMGPHPRRRPRVPLQLITVAFVGALLLTIEAWLDGLVTCSAKTLSEHFIRSQAGGLEWSLGHDAQGLRFVASS